MTGVIPNVPHTLRLDQPQREDEQTLGDAVEVLVENAASDPSSITAQVQVLPDGGALVTLGEAPRSETATNHDANFAEKISNADLMLIAEELARGIEADNESRREWLEDRAEGLKLLALKIDKPGSQAADGTADLDGMSKVRHPMLLEAVLRFQANAAAELLPADGPVKIRVDDTDRSQAPGMGHNGGPTLHAENESDDAEWLQTDFNHYLTAVATEYYPDTDRMLLMTGFGGSGFKKVYRCPVRRRPVSESVDAKDLIVSNDATDLYNAQRITHVVRMSQMTLKRMQVLGSYRDIPLGQPTVSSTNPVEDAKESITGVTNRNTRPEDQEYTLYECHCFLDIPGFEHKEKGKPTGLPLPYRVTMEKETKTILSIHRNWREDDEMQLPRRMFVKFAYVPGLGFYDIGLLNIVGGTTIASTALWRILIDNGMFSNFPGFLYSKAAGRQLTNEFRVPPGGGAPVDTNGDDIRKAIMPLPYQKPDAATMALQKDITETGARVGGTAEIQVGEGRQDAPVGTTIAMIEQATKVMSEVHKRLCRSQGEEFQLLRDLFRDHPEDFWRFTKKRANRWTKDRFLRALENTDIVAAADPNTASHMQRVMAAQALYLMATANPELFNVQEVQKYVMQMSRIPNPERFMAPPRQPGANPDQVTKGKEADAKLLDAQAKLTDTQVKAKEVEVNAIDVKADAENRAADRESRDRNEAMKVAVEMLRSPEAIPAMESTGLLQN